LPVPVARVHRRHLETRERAIDANRNFPFAHTEPRYVERGEMIETLRTFFAGDQHRCAYPSASHLHPWSEA
jgi:hypothetical protein